MASEHPSIPTRPVPTHGRNERRDVAIKQPLFGEVLDEEWHEDAACQGVDVDIFFSLDEDDQRQALELCRSCPVQQDCLRYALEHNELYGIWGGMKESDRRSMIRERRRQLRERERRRSDAA